MSQSLFLGEARVRGTGVTPKILGCIIRSILFRRKEVTVLHMALPHHPGVLFGSGPLSSLPGNWVIFLYSMLLTVCNYPFVDVTVYV